MHTEQAFVGDGYDSEFVIARQPGVHPRVAVTSCRLCTADERNRYIRAAGEADKRASVAADLIVKHVKEWSLEAKIDKTTALKLQPTLADKIIDRLTGYAGSDEEATDLKN